MKYGSALLLAAFAATNVFAHGVIDGVQGANGVNLPGLSCKSTNYIKTQELRLTVSSDR